MNIVLVALLALAASVIYLEGRTRSEAFSVQFKTSLDGNMLKSIQQGPAAIVGGIRSQAQKITYAAMSALPFRHKIREWKRNWKTRNM